MWGLTETHNRAVYSVSELTREIKGLLEETYSFVWISGEISNLSRPASGHLYFTLKDEGAQIGSVLFRTQARNLAFPLENGKKVTGFGRINLYEPRGSYQIVFEYLEPSGVGALHIAFEELKKKLDAEGLFRPERKRALPFLPKEIGVVTSPTGAVIRDILNVLKRRFPNIPVVIYPVRVQGEGAEFDIEAGLAALNDRAVPDVIILARGGGSIEDLFPFNSERVARAIFRSTIPVISAIGHETDFTIADFVADLRAATPSVAAELVVPEKSGLVRLCDEKRFKLAGLIQARLKTARVAQHQLMKRLKHPSQKIGTGYLRIDELVSRLHQAVRALIRDKKNQTARAKDKLTYKSPLFHVIRRKESLKHLNSRMVHGIRIIVAQKKSRAETVTGRLAALSPMAILERGYSITRTLPDRRIVYDADGVEIDQALEVRVKHGTLNCRVEGKNGHG